MMNLHDLWLRLRALMFRKRTELDLDDELKFHIEMQERRNLAQGMDAKQASHQARIKFGPAATVAEECRDARRVTFITEIEQDLRYAFGIFMKRPGFTIVAVFTLALGIGTNTAVFSVVNAVLLRPLHVRDADRMVRLTLRFPRGISDIASLPQFNIFRESTDVFDDISAHRLDFANVTVQSSSEQLPVARVSADFFRLFDAPIIAGRAFSLDEDRPGGERVAILSYGFAVRRFGNYNNATGRTILLGGQPYVVTGVIGSSFDTEQFDQNPEVWVPFQIDPATQDVGGEFCFVTARLKVGVTAEAASLRLRSATDEYRKEIPDSYGRLDLVPLREAMVAHVKPSLIVLLGAVSLVLLIACTNVANLLLIEATRRRREFAIRAAIGAGRSRLIRQLLAESGVLSLAGGAIGLTIGVVAVRALLASYPETNPFLLTNEAALFPRIGSNTSAVTIDWRVAVFTVLISFLATLLFGLLPALTASRAGVFDWLKQASNASSGGIRQNRTRALLVVIQMALALTLLIGAILLIRTSNALQAVNRGFDSKNVLTLRMSVTGTRFDKRSGIDELTRQGTQQIRGLPGVVAASTTCCVPLELVWQLPFTIAGRDPTKTEQPYGEWTFVSPGYFDVFKIPIVRGRDFTTHDDAGAPGAVIINQTMARMFWPTGDPLDDSLVVGRGVRPDYEEDPIRRIVGIVGDVRDQALNLNPRPEMYVPVAQIPDGVTSLNVRLLPLTWVVRTSVEPHTLTAAIERELNGVSGGLPSGRVRSMEEVTTESTARSRFYMWLMMLFGGSALVLALVGVYSVTAYSIQQRTREIGIRISLGATPSGIRNMVILQGLGLGILGVVIGNAGAFLMTRFLSGFLYGITATDPKTFIGASALLTLTVLASDLFLLAGPPKSVLPALCDTNRRRSKSAMAGTQCFTSLLGIAQRNSPSRLHRHLNELSTSQNAT